MATAKREREAASRLYKRMERLRGKIDRLDERLLDVVGERFALVEEIGRLKRALGLHTFQRARWVKMVDSWAARGRARKLDGRFVKRVLSLVHHESLRIQGMSRKARTKKS